MKRGLMIGIIIAIILVVIFGIYSYFSPKDTEGEVSFNVEGTDQIIIVLEMPFNEDSAKSLAEKAIDTAKYSIVGDIAKEDSSWIVSFECNEEVSYVCGGIIIINEINKKISIQNYR